MIVTSDIGPAPSLRVYWVMDEDALRDYAGEGALSTDDNAYFLPQDRDNLRILEMLEKRVGH